MRTIWLIGLALALALFPIAALKAQDITSCSLPKGKSFYHKDGAWTDDKLSDGVFTFKRTANGFDMLYVDGRKKIISSIDDGAMVALLRQGPQDATFFVMYPQNVIALYTIWEDREGKGWMDWLQSAGGSSPVHKSALMVGSCQSINWGVFK